MNNSLRYAMKGFFLALLLCSTWAFADRAGHKDGELATDIRPVLTQEEVNQSFNAEVDACVNNRVQSSAEFQRSILLGVLQNNLKNSK